MNRDCYYLINTMNRSFQLGNFHSHILGNYQAVCICITDTHTHSLLNYKVISTYAHLTLIPTYSAQQSVKHTHTHTHTHQTHTAMRQHTVFIAARCIYSSSI
eukprot:GHVQ01019849.1.p1 GENE.GHVQ01019849.1~~GHVQ01019849.1.p1  ORF type:complete len:102 (-),score=16.87 GHVQ01019849.1:73-378(-)